MHRSVVPGISQLFRRGCLASHKGTCAHVCDDHVVTEEERRALVIEDDSDIRGLLVHSLSMQGFVVEGAHTGRLGVELARSTSPDIITLDLGLPDIDGIEVCRRIREFSDAYLIMVTARPDEIDRLIGLETGADDYMSKPFSPRELQARVKAMFRRPRSTTTPRDQVSDEPDTEQFVHGPLTVTVESRMAVLDGAELSLTRTEFDLLATLMSSPKRVWTRDVLLRTVWGDEWATDHHLVEVHVGNLRRKLGDSGQEARFIRTIRGVGYRMQDPEAS